MAYTLRDLFREIEHKINELSNDEECIILTEEETVGYITIAKRLLAQPIEELYNKIQESDLGPFVTREAFHNLIVTLSENIKDTGETTILLNTGKSLIFLDDAVNDFLYENLEVMYNYTQEPINEDNLKQQVKQYLEKKPKPRITKALENVRLELDRVEELHLWFDGKEKYHKDDIYEMLARLRANTALYTVLLENKELVENILALTSLCNLQVELELAEKEGMGKGWKWYK